MVSNCGAWIRFKHRNTRNTSESLSTHLGTNDTLIMIATYHMLETRLKGQRYADRMEEHPNILATNLVKEVGTSRRLKRKFSQDLCTVIYTLMLTGHMLFHKQDLHKLSNVSLNVTQSDNL